MTSRRGFLKLGTLGAIAAGFSVGLSDRLAARAAFGTAVASHEFDRAAFASQLRTTFLIKQGRRTVPVKLIEVTDLGSRRSGGLVREAFSLIFLGSTAMPLKQDTYKIEHDKLGALSFLVVPILARDRSAQYYEISINRLHG